MILTYRKKFIASELLNGVDVRCCENVAEDAIEARMNELASYTPDAPRKTRDFTYFCYQIGIES